MSDKTVAGQTLEAWVAAFLKQRNALAVDKKLFHDLLHNIPSGFVEFDCATAELTWIDSRLHDVLKAQGRTVRGWTARDLAAYIADLKVLQAEAAEDDEDEDEDL